MKNSKWVFLICVLSLLLFSGCGTSSADFKKQSLSVDVLIKNGQVYIGNGSPAVKVDVGVVGDKISYIGNSDEWSVKAKTIIDAQGKIVAPGFIDPHTHSLEELKSNKTKANLNYLTQGVTTVFNGNDGTGPIELAALAKKLTTQGIGTNTAFFVGHGTVREQVMGRSNRKATPVELEQMQSLVAKAMQEGAMGLSSGLYYAPGSFAETSEVVALAKIAAKYGGVYDTHIRDESSYNIGLLGAIKEALKIGKSAGIHLHIAHIKALGVDVWGQSKQVIQLIEAAQQQGQSVSADQYPWQASGTHINNALIPRWVMAGTKDEYRQRLTDPKLLPRIKEAIQENIRKRGGADTLLIVQAPDTALNGLTLSQIAQQKQKDVVTTTLDIALSGSTRVASFNMTKEDIKRFMIQPWVMTSSDGNNGHPRKYASFPKKFQDFVIAEQRLTIEQFIYKSSGLVADTFGLSGRGYIALKNQADIIVFDPKLFKPNADFKQWNVLSSGIEYALVNGAVAISGGQYQNSLGGRVLLNSCCSE